MFGWLKVKFEPSPSAKQENPRGVMSRGHLET